MTDPRNRVASPRGDDGLRWTLSPSARKAVPDLVGDRVLEMVQAGELAPGDRLPTEPELARLMGVARSSVRTALQRLEARGVVEVNRGRGWFVSAEPERSAADLMLDRLASRHFDLADVMEVRIALECTAVALAAARAPSGTLDWIAKLARDDRETDAEDRATLLRTDEEFHGEIVAAAGNDYLRTLYEMLTPLVAEWRERSFANADVHDRSAADHNQIATLLRRRDEVASRIAMSSHLLGQYRGMARERTAERGEETPAATSAAYVDVDDEPMFRVGGELRDDRS
jgi:GntR family transcriptional regulator, transcriptional repressor for pyruvate dehydrogenase complex